MPKQQTQGHMCYTVQGRNKLIGRSADIEAIRAVAVSLSQMHRLHLAVIQKGLDFAAERTYFILV